MFSLARVSLYFDFKEMNPKKICEVSVIIWVWTNSWTDVEQWCIVGCVCFPVGFLIDG